LIARNAILPNFGVCASPNSHYAPTLLAVALSGDPQRARTQCVCWLVIMFFTSPAMTVRMAPPAPPPTI